MEYASNYLAMLQQAQRTGADIQVLPCGVNGTISVPALQELMASPVGHRVKVVSVVWIPTNSGVVNDVAAVGAVIAASGRAADIVFMIDACQAVGQISIDVVALGCQVLTGTGRKYLRGPRGTGFLYVQHAALDRHLAEPVTIDLRSATWLRALATTTTTTESVADQGNGDTCKHSDDQSCLTTAPYEYTYTVAAGARRFEQWERNVAGLIGLGAAVSYLLDTVGEKHAYSELVRLAMCLRRRLTDMRSDGVIVWDRCSSCTSSYSRRDRGTTTLVTESSTNKYTAVDVDVDAIADDSSSLCGLVTFTVHGVDAQIVKQELETCRMYVSVTYPSSSWLDASARSLPTAGLVRASLHYYNTTDEIEKFCCELKRIIENCLHQSASK